MLKTNLTFTSGQLTLIRTCAEQCLPDGSPSRVSDEWAVFETIKFAAESFDPDQLVILHLIAKHCEARHLGPMAVHQCAAVFNELYSGEELAQYPALVTVVVDTVSPETAQRVTYDDGVLPSTHVPARIDFGADGMGRFSLN